MTAHLLRDCIVPVMTGLYRRVEFTYLFGDIPLAGIAYTYRMHGGLARVDLGSKPYEMIPSNRRRPFPIIHFRYRQLDARIAALIESGKASVRYELEIPDHRPVQCNLTVNKITSADSKFNGNWHITLDLRAMPARSSKKGDSE